MQYASRRGWYVHAGHASPRRDPSRRSLCRRRPTTQGLRCTPSSDTPVQLSPVGASPQPTGKESPKAAPPRGITFQKAIAALQAYWSSVGCAVWLPHNTEVGAGTMNPATFLRVLGPEPWNVCYAEPSIRPDDSRYGQNPNRIQRHTQFQVILKPDPGNPQELYLRSLAVLGIDPDAHDIRFVEDNWESPVLGAWGLGWEVWLDGLEITQFTYFQQAGSLALPVPAIEITYGLERILMSLQKVHHFKEIQYTETLSYGELLLQTEIEMSQYNMDEALVEDHWKRFELYKVEAKHLLERDLALPAYDNLLKCSQAFNVLDARGAVGVTERNVCFGEMRKLTRRVASLWLEQRTKLEFPLLKTPSQHVGLDDPLSVLSAAEPRDFVLEIGCEEIPPDDVTAALHQLRAKFKALLEEARLEYDELDVQGTMRRLVVWVKGLVAAQTALSLKVKGPPVSIAYNADGQPTKALIGFCKKNNCSMDAVTVEVGPKGAEFVYAEKVEEPLNAAQVLTAKLPEMLKTITFKRSMRWNGDVAWSRPIRWILALHGDIVLPVRFAQTTAGSTTQLLRSRASEEIPVLKAEQYGEVVGSAGILLNVDKRREMIWDCLQQGAKTVHGEVPERFSNSLLDEVVHLVEAPSVVVGSFSSEFLSLPNAVLETVMQKYQRYFPVYSQVESDQMLPYFLAVGNGSFSEVLVRSGYEDVLRARFKDAQFFYDTDVQQPLESFRPKLEGTLFHKDLGNLLQKTERTYQLVTAFSRLMELEHSIKVAQRAAELARADLATSLVTEMTSLAGMMGQHYALQSGEGEEVAQAIFEGSLPRFAGDQLPVTPAGLVVSVADKMDSLVGLVAVKCTPTATADPYGLRRMANGLVEALIRNQISFNIPEGIDQAAAVQPVDVTAEVRENVFLFVRRRLEQLLLDRGNLPEVVRSVLAERGANPSLAEKTASELMQELAKGSDSLLPGVMTAMGRVIRISRGRSTHGPVDASLFQQKEEHALWRAYQRAQSRVKGESLSVGRFLQICEEDLVEVINAFFDGVFVMCEEEALQQNRLRLLKAVASLPSGILDFSELPGF